MIGVFSKARVNVLCSLASSACKVVSILFYIMYVRWLLKITNKKGMMFFSAQQMWVFSLRYEILKPAVAFARKSKNLIHNK
jgi:hypothetical protein